MRDLLSYAKRGIAVLLTAAMVLTGNTLTLFAEENTITDNSEMTDDVVMTDDNATADESVITDDGAVELIQEEDPATASSLNGTLVSALNGMADTNEKVFSAAMTQKNEVKLSWKGIKKAKYFSLERLNMDGTTTTLLSKNNKKASFTDKSAAKTEDTSFIYQLTAYDKDIAKIGSYSVVCSPLVMAGQTLGDTGNMAITYSQIKGGVQYSIERAEKKNKNEFYSSLPMTSSLNGEVSAYNGVEAMSYSDMDGNLMYGTYYYYRVKASITSEGGKTFTSAYSNAFRARATLPEAVLYGVVGKHKDGAVCNKEGYFQFSEVEDAAKYEILRSSSESTGYKTIASVKSNSDKLETVTTSYNGKSVTALQYRYSSFKPGVKYYYKVRAVGVKSIPGALSNSVAVTCQFDEVSGVDVTSVSVKSLQVSWNWDPCATSYEVFRSTGVEKALDGTITQPANDSDYTRIAKVSSDTKDKKTNVITYLDSTSGLTEGLYYFYRLVPVNGKAKGPLSTMTDCAKPEIGTPKTVKAEGVAINSIEITWSSVYGAKSYVIQRSTSYNAADPTAFEKAKTDLKTVTKSDQIFKDRLYTDKCTIGTNYYYRVMAKGDKELAPEIIAKAKIVKGFARPKAVSGIKTVGFSSGKGAKINWNNNTENTNKIDNYLIERSEDSGKTWETIATVADSGNKTSYLKDKESFKNGTLLKYRICALYEDGALKVEGKKTVFDFENPTSAELSASNASMKVGTIGNLRINKFKPAGTTMKKVRFTSSNTNVATVSTETDGDGNNYAKVTAKAAGTATIRAYSDFVDNETDTTLATCNLTVTK